MATTTVTVQHGRSSDYSGTATMRPKQATNRLIDLLAGVAGGAYAGTSIQIGQTAATGTLTISSGSGTVGGTINGVSVTVTWGTSDTATATALAAAINASSNALVNQHVTASSALGVVTLTAKNAGPAGNTVTLAASGTGVTASGTRLTGGSATTYTF